MAAKATSQTDDPGKVLRIGIVQAGKVIHERLIRPGQSVTVGSSPKNTFAFQVAGFPSQHVLFQARGNRYFLNFNEKMAGKIAFRDGIVSLDQLQERGEATRKGPHFVLPLSEKNRGKIVIDDVTVLFQFVAAPPESARMMGKQDFRPKLMDEDDPVFLGFLALFSSIATVMMIWALNQEPIERISLEQIPDRFVDIVLPKEDREPPPEIEPEIDENLKGPEVEKEKPDESSEAQASKKPKKEMTQEERAAAEAKRLQEKKENLARKSAVLAMIGTRGERNSGDMVEDVFAEGDSNFSSLEDALRDVSSAEIANSENVATVKGQQDGGGRGDATIGGIESGGGGTASVSSAPAAQVKKASLSTSGADVGGAEGADAIKSVLRSKSGQVKYCYEQRLKENPNISGRIAVEVSIAAGRVTSAVVVENTTGDSALESCVTRKIRSWRFAEEAEGDIYLPFALSAN
jgi:outer membrane biosynthesis protein TonB